jgi:ubiquinol-cytochrome c reductase iron-sulfur subunit
MALSVLGHHGHATLTRRTILRALVRAGVLIVLAAFAAVFVRGLLAPGGNDGDVIELSGMAPGSARLESWDGRPVWVVNRSDEQLEALAAVSEYVTKGATNDPSPVANPLRSLKRRYGIYLADTRRPGILVQYTLERPGSLGIGTPWFGGFVDPASGAAFDIAGRPYRTARGRPLAVPPYRFVGPARIRFGEW